VAAGRIDIGEARAAKDSRGRLERAADAAHVLSDLVWEELHEQLSSRHSAQLAERLADLASTVALLARAGGGATSSPASTAWEETRAAAAAAPATDARPAAVLIDEHDEQADRFWASSARRPRDGREGNGRPGSPAWLGLIESALAQFERDRVPFAVLLLEVLDAGEPPGANEQIESALARAFDAFGPVSIAAEGPHRYWLLVPHADRLGALILADRLARALEGVDDDAGATDAAERYFAALSARGPRPHAGDVAAPLRLVVGTAACPDHGRDVSALVAQAHIEVAAACAAGAPVEAASEPA
jgi:hypothetical protein